MVRENAQGRAGEGGGAFVIEPGGQDEPPIGGEVRQDGVRWELVMAFFFRFTAAIWMLKGIGFWMLVLGMGDLPLSEERRLRQALIVAFAILDCSAAVGLWLLTPWGRGMWLVLALFEIVLAFAAPSGTVGLFAATGALLSIFCYAALTLAIRQQPRR